MGLCAATFVVLCAIAATGAAAQSVQGWGAAVQGIGRRCPRPAMATAAGRRRVRRLLRSLRGRRYEVGERLRITLTTPGFRPEVAAVVFRYARLPVTRLLRS